MKGPTFRDQIGAEKWSSVKWKIYTRCESTAQAI